MRSLLLLFFISSAQISFGCTCINVNPLSETEFKGYNLIVKGTIISVDTANNSRKILIRITDIYKGAKGQSEALIVTAIDDEACGINPKINETWLIYSLEMAQYNYYTDRCTKSKSLDVVRKGKDAKEVSAELKFLQKKKSGRS